MSTAFLRSPSEGQQGRGGRDFARPWIADQVAAQAVARPEAIAVTDGANVLTYDQVNRHAGELAERLRAIGAGPDALVAVCLPRSPAMIAGALGILQAGAAYLPLDPAWPIARMQFVLHDAQPAALVTDEAHAAGLAHGSLPVSILDRKGKPARTQSITGVACASAGLDSGNLAYVIYTSGSTGQPKGVEISHASLENLIRWHQMAFTVMPQDRATQLASPGFDAAVWEVWPYLTAGATLYVPDEDTVGLPERLRDWMVRHEITISFVPTPIAERLLGLEWPSNTRLRFLLTGADVLRHYPPATLPFAVVNNYGPTECSVVTTSGTVAPGACCAHGLPSIGRPITGAEVYILDDHLRPVSRGQTGELYIGGAGLARGYRNREDLTAERFINHRFEEGPEVRLYKTGDMASYLLNGEIAFAGRIDDQVKINGYRIEIQEVTAAVEQHPAVNASVVVADEHLPGEKRLLAYVVPNRGAELTDSSLREFLQLKLPDYMIPSAFCRLDALPLTASGKVDKKALPQPSKADMLGNDEYIAPRTPTEEQLAKMLCSLLHVDRVGVNDDFFLLGGNSLLGAQVIARTRDIFGVDLPLLSLFDHPTISELAAEIEDLILAKVQRMTDDEARRIAAD